MAPKRLPADIAARAAQALRQRKPRTDGFRRETFALPRFAARLAFTFDRQVLRRLADNHHRILRCDVFSFIELVEVDLLHKLRLHTTGL